MSGNHLEELAAEWYEIQGYFVRRNVQVGPRPKGGYECELDIIAFHPVERRLVHLEASSDADNWTKREQRFKKKFGAGKKHIPHIFAGVDLPEEPDKIALLVFAARGTRNKVGGGRIVLIKEFMAEIFEFVKTRRVNKAAIPEQYPLLRTLQFAAHYWPLR